MCANKKLVTVRHGVGLDLLAEALVSAHKKNTTYHLAKHTAKRISRYAADNVLGYAWL